MRLRWLLTIMCLMISLIPIAMISGLQGIEIMSLFLGLILLITLTVAFFVSYFISMPLVKLTKNIDEISKGNLDVELEKSEIYEINTLTESLDRVMASLKLAINKVGVKKDEIFQDAVKAKEDAEAKYEILLKKIDGWIWEIDEKGICTKCSAKITGTLGYSPKQIIGKEIFNLLSPEDGNKFKDMMFVLSQKKTEIANKFDLHWMNQDNTHKVWVRSFCIPVFNSIGDFQGLRCFSRDATEYLVAERKINELENRLSETYKQLHEVLQQPKQKTLIEPDLTTITEQEFDYMILFDEDAKIIDCTNDIQKRLGFTKEEMLTLTFADVVYLESYKDIKASLDEIKKQGSTQIKSIHKKKDGSSVFVSEHITYLKDRNMFICMVKQDKL
ncbi:MAG TPA: PAS domain S-box protein [Candidatus Thermoplasmatota archaeon]|nr:PAS domain S-box protein [Candidatus Thermoplasmatota archaeon]